jgi:predicted nuclease of restriction endonuclease-like (RecB) superfamily
LVGERIRKETLKSGRAAYGEQIISTLSRRLAADFGNGYTRPNLFRMIRFAELFPDREIVSTLSRQLSWSHFVEILQLNRDPYFLDFLGLKDAYNEKDLETAILREMEQFILELGAGFTFVARQKRIVIDGEDFYLDLLFYHRKLRRLVAVELKLERFKAADKGQMELYLRWLEKHEMEPGEETPIGLILCADKGDEQIELLRLDKSGIRVASYLTDLPPRQLLQRKLHEMMIVARARLEGRLIEEGERE